MKTSLLAILTSATVLAFSSLAFAGGEGCEWKKNRDAHKGMSAEAFQQFKKDHAWVEKDAHGKKELTERSTANKDGVRI